MNNIRTQTVIKAFFTGKASHAAAAPDFGRSAFGALLVAISAIERNETHLPQGTSISYEILSSGDLAVNIVPDKAEGSFFLGADTEEKLYWLKGRLEEIVKGATLATGTISCIKEEKET